MDLTEHLQRHFMAGKTVFVTGGGSGINLAIASSFARVGADVAICGRTAEKLEAAAAQLRALGARALPVPADVRDLDAMRAAFARTREELGPVSAVVAGAAGNFLAPAEKLSSNGFRTVVDIDLQGAFHTASAAFQDLKETRGALLFVSAGQSYMPFVQQAHVGAAKAGIDSLMRTLALEWGGHGIRCNSIAPGPVEGTEGMERLAETVGHDTWAATTALGRYATKEEIGAMAVVLCSPLASYVTGVRLDVDGGTALSGSGIFNAAVARAAAG
ncbi:MAG TPA: SDR family oxidoreductase [Baekduia sp.]|nr:SDR family oxidoreductase [Baekduia sp.]